MIDQLSHSNQVGTTSVAVQTVSNEPSVVRVPASNQISFPLQDFDFAKPAGSFLSPMSRARLELRFCDPCVKECDCVCHGTWSWNSSPLFQYLGSLSFGFSGVWPFRPPCSQPHCKRGPGKIVSAAYSFPPWMLRRAVHILVQNTTGEPTLGFFVQNRIPEFQQNALITLASKGELKAVKHILSRREGTPNDAETSLGKSAFQVRRNR
ncbi:hypothetical protein F5B17DRAFT_62588 [Nemania serpens]|nr:hypothetical protein F5B17DRAFT_62588 [Nemania serpens]